MISVKHICGDCHKIRYTKGYGKTNRCMSCATALNNKKRGQSRISREKIAASLIGKCGRESRNYQGKDCYSNEYRLMKQREYRKKYPERIKRYQQSRLARKRAGGLLTSAMIQRVYEDNIKLFGTLTCIYCLCPIEFGKDSLEHKVALANGGTNDYENLAVACISCNCSKKDKNKFRPTGRVS